MSKEIFDPDTDGEFEDEIQEEAPKHPPTDFFKRNRGPTPSECIDVVEMAKGKVGRPPGSLNKNHEYKKKKLEREEAIKKLWKLGKLHWKLDGLQKELYNAYHSKPRGKFIWSVSRQVGKSWTVCTIALEEAIRNPGIRMAYIAPELNDAKDITEQTFDQLCEDAPAEFKPKFNSLKNRWEWSNGSILKVAGTDNKNYNKIRGRKFDIIFLDEFCFMDEFKKVFFSCVKPTTTSVPNYKIIFISTPPETPDHESNMILDDAEEDGSLIKKTIYDSPRFSPEFIEENILKDYRSLGGKNSIEFRREFMVERIADASKLVIPEASKEKMAEIVADVPKPEFFNIFEAFDWGVKDSNGGLFAYVDFEKQCLVIEDELLAHDSSATTYDIAKQIIIKEEDNWGQLRGKAQRFADNNLQIINDMSLSHNLHMAPTNKDNLAAQVQKVRHLLGNGQIIINPRCVNLIEQIQSAQWNSTRKSFVRRNGHHYDLVAALIYLVRNCNLEVSPFPVDYKLHKMGYHPDTHFKSPHYDSGITNINKEFVEHLKNSFTIKKRR